MKRVTVLHATAAAAIALGLALGVEAQQAPVPKNLQVLPKTITQDELTLVMRSQAAGLGVKCDFCHVQGDPAADTKPHKLQAREMMRMVRQINETTFKDSKVKVECFTCHKGKAEPQVHAGTPAPVVK
jgi:hypothetical protein